MKTEKYITHHNLKHTEDITMKTTKSSNQIILTIAIVLLSIIAFGQDNGSTENLFSKKPFRSMRSDYNKSNPIVIEPISASDVGSGNQIESSFSGHERLQVDFEKSKELPRERQSPENTRGISAKHFYNYPNPFVERTTIEYEVERPVYVNLSIYHNGYLIKIIASDFHDASNHRAVFDAAGLPAGIYTAVLTLPNEVITHNMYKVAEREH